MCKYYRDGWAIFVVNICLQNTKIYVYEIGNRVPNIIKSGILGRRNISYRDSQYLQAYNVEIVNMHMPLIYGWYLPITNIKTVSI